MLRFLYICLLRLHPRRFRRRFAQEMLWIFDEAGSAGPLLADGVKSLARQWALRSEADTAEQPARAFDGVPTFYTSETSSPRPAALINGAVLASAVLAALALGIVHGGGRIVAASWSGLGYGSPRYTSAQTSSRTYDSLNPSLWAEVKEFFGGFVQSQPPAAAPPNIASAPQPDPQPAVSIADLLNAYRVPGGVATGYVRSIPAAALPEPVASYAHVVFTLDANGDGRISKAERFNAVAEMFRELLDRADRNHDGFITREELRNEIRSRADTNKDGVVTWEELENAIRSGALKWPGTAN